MDTSDQAAVLTQYMEFEVVLKPSFAGVRALLNIEALSANMPVTTTAGSRGNLIGRRNSSKFFFVDNVLRSFSICN